jgi:hypothetical protein
MVWIEPRSFAETRLRRGYRPGFGERDRALNPEPGGKIAMDGDGSLVRADRLLEPLLAIEQRRKVGQRFGMLRMRGNYVTVTSFRTRDLAARFEREAHVIEHPCVSGRPRQRTFIMDDRRVGSAAFTFEISDVEGRFSALRIERERMAPCSLGGSGVGATKDLAEEIPSGYVCRHAIECGAATLFCGFYVAERHFDSGPFAQQVGTLRRKRDRASKQGVRDSGPAERERDLCFA